MPEPPPLVWSPAERSPEDTEPDFPSTAFSRPALAGGATPGPRPQLVWSPPPPAGASAVDRAAASVVDAAVVLAVLAVATVLTSLLLSRGLHWVYRDESAGGALVGTNPLALPLLALLPAASAVAYCGVVPGVAGATLGMRVLGLRLSRDVPGGGRVGVRLGLLRLALFCAGCAALLLGPLSLLRDPRRRAWHDRATGTVVAHR